MRRARIVVLDLRLILRCDATPALAFAIPGAMAIVAVPIGTEHESNDGNADANAVLRDQDAAAFIFLLKVVRGHPTTVITVDHVAP